jgi:virulence-associated protein VagC
MVNRFAFAASFVLVFALGAALTLNPGRESGDTIGVSQKNVKVPPMQNNVKDDQLLYSAGEGSTPETSDTAIKLLNSGHDYLVIPRGFQRTLGVGKTWNSTKALGPKILDCLKSQELDRWTNLIDAGFLNEKVVKAIWTPAGPSSWNIYLIDAGCNVLEKKFLEE